MKNKTQVIVCMVEENVVLWNPILFLVCLMSFGYIKPQNLYINRYKIYLEIGCCHQNQEIQNIFSENVISEENCKTFLQTKDAVNMEA
jgi:hypothetical protein